MFHMAWCCFCLKYIFLTSIDNLEIFLSEINRKTEVQYMTSQQQVTQARSDCFNFATIQS